MTPAALKLVADFEAAAKAAQEAEAALRRSMAEEIARIERERAFAFRRTHLVRLLASSAEGAEDEAAALAAQSEAACREFGWSAERPAHKEILERLAPVGKAVWQCACTLQDQVDATATNDALRKFEDWFEQARGQSFYRLFEHHIPDTPLVDF
jgi:hypothetical protein